MEHVIVAVIIIFLLLFGVLTLSNAFISAQETLQELWEEMNTRSNDLTHTALSPVEMRVLDSGSLIEVTVRNSGTLKLAGFERWDVFAEYYDKSVATPTYHMDRLTYSSSEATDGEWSVAQIYLDKAHDIPENFEVGILNPGEELTLHLKISPTINVGDVAQVTVSTPNGVTASLMSARNTPPTLVLDNGLKIPSGGGGVISSDDLQVVDIDNDASQLVYTIATLPVQGALAAQGTPISQSTPAASGTPAPQTGFTQKQIDNNQVVYTNAGEATPDSFDFTVSDGIDTIGPFNFPITINKIPVLETTALTMTIPAGSTGVINDALLHTTDEDDLPTDLVYTVTQLPADGYLSFSPTFRQSDIDSDSLTYTHTGTDSDMFKFVVSDGYNVIGTYTFNIIVIPVELTEESTEVPTPVG